MGGEGFFGEIYSLSEGVTHDVGVKRSVQQIHLFEKVACLLMHARLGKLSRNFFELVIWNSEIVSRHTIGCFCWQTAFQIELDGSLEVAFSLLDFSGLCLLICV